MLLTPLELGGWLEFNQWRTNLKPHRFVGTAGGGPEIRAVLYLDRRGRVMLPPNNPYLSVVFESGRSRPSGRTAEWHRAAMTLVEEMKRRGSANQLHFPPEVDDVRPWSWSGFVVSVRYTYYLDYPYDRALVEGGTRRLGDKARRLGMSAERVADVGPVIECLVETEARQRFSHYLGRRELETARELLGEDSLRMYVCFDQDGLPASSCVAIHAPGTRAIEWLAGTKTARLGDGSGQLLHQFLFDDLESAGAVGVDLCGANNPSVAAFKSRWGPRLVANYSVRTYSLRAGGRFVADWVHSR